METLEQNETLINEEIIEPIDIIEGNVENLNEDTNISDNYLNTKFPCNLKREL